MSKLKLVNLGILATLGVIGGFTKILRTQNEIEFFQAAGLGEASLLILGIVQLLGGASILFVQTRLVGAVLLAVTFLISTVMIFSIGSIEFGWLTLLPVVMAGWVVRDTVVSSSPVKLGH